MHNHHPRKTDLGKLGYSHGYALSQRHMTTIQREVEQARLAEVCTDKSSDEVSRRLFSRVMTFLGHQLLRLGQMLIARYSTIPNSEDLVINNASSSIST